MDSAEEPRDYDAMDHSQVNSVFVEDFLAVWDGSFPILDVGTGTAQIPIELCRKHARVRVTGIDLAGHMLAVGKKNVHESGFGDRIRLELADAKHMPFTSRSFGAVISNSIVHHIPEPRLVLSEMLQMVKPGGRLFVRDLLRPANAAELAGLVNKHAADANDHQRKMFAESLHAALTVDEVQELVAILGCEPAEVVKTSDRHWTWSTIR
jgi:ubiquinone/menaquinone biosynthesis C-methylase UbiE